VASSWRVQDTNDPIDAVAAMSLLRGRLLSAQWETWFECDSGALLAVVTNGQRAMVMLLREPGDAGEHAIDESAVEGTSSGYVLANGQVDTYADRDTVPFDDAMIRVACVLDEHVRPASEWKVDR
jgi:predicted type IV restriction endonuclease